ncbi:GNAT family N-acetyltransferase [Candidatus Micrarchaeota archaeon]|nr:GNAT family N-acetyltransferase [Candidatus Micrarchaeota archaeon]
MDFIASKLEIRKATRRELYSITVLTRKFFPYTGFNMQMIEKRLKNRKIHYYAALYDKFTIGFIDFKENEKSIKILGLAVLPEFQRRGVGKKLLEIALKFAKEKKKEIIYLLLSKENFPAAKLYEKEGFVIKGKLEKRIWDQEILLLQRKLE